jgi:hypothetical protein
MNPLISTLHLLLENRSIAYSKWPRREHEYLERQIMMGSIRVEQLPNGRRISILNNELLLNEITERFPAFGEATPRNTRYEAVIAERDAHLSSITYPGLGVRRLRNTGEIKFDERTIELNLGMKSYLNIIEKEFSKWSICGKIVLIENLEPFLHAEVAHPNYDFALYYAGVLSSNVIDWLTNQKVDVLVAPDYDPVGLSQYEKTRRTMDSKLWVPEDIGIMFHKFHKKETLSKKNNRSFLLSLIESSDLANDTIQILDLISEYQAGLDQEIFYPVHSEI